MTKTPTQSDEIAILTESEELKRVLASAAYLTTKAKLAIEGGTIESIRIDVELVARDIGWIRRTWSGRRS
jgi:hypothetical protein